MSFLSKSEWKVVAREPASARNDSKVDMISAELRDVIPYSQL